MPGQFSTIASISRTLQAQQVALETSAHNIANANTPGFTRQRAVMAATTPFPMPGVNRGAGPGQIGTGVDVVSINRIRSEFLDGQIRIENATLAQWEIKRDYLQQVESVYMEPTDSGLNSLLGQFWDSWHELSKNGESSPVRVTVLETAKALGDAIRHISSQLGSIKADINRETSIMVLGINSISDQITKLNRQITHITLSGHQPNDLMDQRDKLLDDLAQYMDYQVEPVLVDGLPNGAIRVIGSGVDDDGLKTTVNFVDGESARHLQLVEVDGSYQVSWEELVDQGEPELLMTVNNGRINGALTGGDELIQGYIDDLDRLARGLIARVNEVHQQGKDLDGIDGEDFFTGSGADDLDVAAAIKDNSRKIAASDDGSPGDGSVALAIVQMRTNRLQNGDENFSGEALPSLVDAGATGGTTFDQFYQDMIARLGVDAHESGRMVANQEVLVSQLENRREEISGVSVDEEVANIIQYQRVYQATARVLSTIDDMLDTLINRT